MNATAVLQELDANRCTNLKVQKWLKENHYKQDSERKEKERPRKTWKTWSQERGKTKGSRIWKDTQFKSIRNFPKGRLPDCSLKLAQLALRFRHIKTTTTGQVNDAPERSGHSSKDLDSALPSKTPSESWFIWCYEMLRVDSSRFSRFRLRLQQACKRQNCCANPLSGLDWRLLVKRYDRCDCVLQVNRLCKLRRCCHKDVSKRRKLKQIMCQRGDCLLKASAPLNRFNLVGRPGAHLSRACWKNKARIQLFTSCTTRTNDSFIWNSLRKHGKWSKVTKFEERRWLSAKDGQTMTNRELWSLMLEANFVQAGAGSSQWHTVIQD